MDWIKKELQGFKKSEIIFFLAALFSIIIASFLTGDGKTALVSALCGVSYTILAGKGKILCYFIGIIGTLCYCSIALDNGFFGNLFLYAFYYLPMEIIGIFKWRRHYDKERGEIIKTSLSVKQRCLYFVFACFFTVCSGIVLGLNGGKSPFMDAFTTVFSVVGLLLTVQRCVEQWYVWFFVNLVSLLMWLFAYLNGSKCLATVLMWGVYLIVAVYFMNVWNRELKSK